MKKWIIYFVIIFTGFLSLSSCRENRDEPVLKSSESAIKKDADSEKNANSLQPSDISALPGKKEDSMVASVNDTTITQLEIDREVQILMREYQEKVPPNQMGQLKTMLQKQALDNLINKTLLFQKAEEEGIKLEKKVIDDKLKEIAKLFPNPEQFNKKLASMGLTEDLLRQNIKQNFKIESLLETITTSSDKTTDKEIVTFYNDNPQKFQTGEQVRASHILISSKPEESEDVRAQKRQKIAKLKEEITNGANFAEAASNHSDCPSKSKGGDLGFFEKGKMVPAFEEAAFQMKIGEVSDIVETQFGYHLIMVTDHKDKNTIPLEQAKDKIQNHLNNQKKGQVVNDYLNKLRGSATIKRDTIIQGE